MSHLIVPLRHQHGDRSRSTWGQSYDELSLGFRTRADFDSVVQSTTTYIACGDDAVRTVAKDAIANFSARKGVGIGEIGMLELIARVGMLLNEMANAPK